jgi:hypothetical protein
MESLDAPQLSMPEQPTKLEMLDLLHWHFTEAYGAELADMALFNFMLPYSPLLSTQLLFLAYFGPCSLINPIFHPKLPQDDPIELAVACAWKYFHDSHGIGSASK